LVSERRSTHTNSSASGERRDIGDGDEGEAARPRFCGRPVHEGASTRRWVVLTVVVASFSSLRWTTLQRIAVE
jgi:hypothetical protein